MLTPVFALGFAAIVLAHGGHDDQKPVSGPLQSLWYSNALPGDGGTQADSVFSGISTFGRLPYAPCLSYSDASYDIAFIGW
jgi:agmatinase